MFKKFWEKVDTKLDALIEKRSTEFARQLSTSESDGTKSQDLTLAERLYREMHRRGELSKEMYVHEPLKWLLFSSVLGVGVSLVQKYTVNKNHSTFSSVLTGVCLVTALAAGVTLLRIMPRFEASMKAGADAVIAMDKVEHLSRETIEGKVINPEAERTFRRPAQPACLTLCDETNRAEVCAIRP